MRLGEFDPHEMNPYWSIPFSIIQSQSHRDLALLATMQSFVLLKNSDYLPLKKANLLTKKAAVLLTLFFFERNFLKLNLNLKKKVYWSNVQQFKTAIWRLCSKY